MAPPAVPQISAKEFLQAIWGDEKGVAELTIIGSKLRKEGFKVAYPFSYPDSIDSFLSSATNHNRSNNVYMGVCLRREKWASNSRGTEALALSSGCIWAEFDFADQGHKGKTVPEEIARKALLEFPRKPSIIVRSGGGIQVFWLTKELVTGNDLWHLKAINRALAKFFGADTQSIDLARVLRIPWTTNFNYDPVRTVEISWWHPEFRYNLDDFDFLPIEEERRLVGAPVSPSASPTPSSPATPKADATPSETFLQQAASPEGTPDPLPTPTIELPEETIQELGKLVSQIWIEGDRHNMAMSVAGWFIRTGVKESCTRKVVEIASELNKGDTKKRLKDVADTYKNLNLKGLTGRKHIEELIHDKHPEGPIRASYEKLLKSINTRLPRKKGHRRDEQPVDFKFLHLIQFKSQPSRWTVTLEREAKEYIITLDNSRFSKFKDFRQEVLDQHGLPLTSDLHDSEWMTMIDEAKKNNLYEEKEAPEDSRPAGAIELALEEFLAEAKKDPDVGLLKKYPGFDDEHQFFKFATFHEFMGETDAKITKNHLREKLKDMGWKSDTKRFSRGGGVQRLWMKSIIQGGGTNGNGNGHGTPSPTTPAVTPSDHKPTPVVVPEDPTEDLFPVGNAPDADS